MTDIALAAADRLLRKANAKRVTNDAVEEFRDILEDLALEIAKKAMTRLEYYDKIFFGDAFEHNFEDYATIYFYCPISNTENMQKLYVQIFEQIKVGTIMKEMLPENGLRKFLEDNGVKRYSGEAIFIQKGYSRKHKKDICKLIEKPKEK